MNSRGTSVSIWTAVSPRASTPHRMAAATMPAGLFCPRNATAMPVKPRATSYPIGRYPRSPRSCCIPTSPASAPESRKSFIWTPPIEMPPARAVPADAPTARAS